MAPSMNKAPYDSPSDITTLKDIYDDTHTHTRALPESIAPQVRPSRLPRPAEPDRNGVASAGDMRPPKRNKYFDDSFKDAAWI